MHAQAKDIMDKGEKQPLSGNVLTSGALHLAYVIRPAEGGAAIEIHSGQLTFRPHQTLAVVAGDFSTDDFWLRVKTAVVRAVSNHLDTAQTLCATPPDAKK